MIDREKIINYAEETLSNVLPDEKDTSGIMVKVGWIREVLALLKEQESVVPGLEQDAYGIYSTCGNCKARLWKMFGVEFEVNPDAMPKFCPQCGKAVKWE